jgi:hypothetical protein
MNNGDGRMCFWKRKSRWNALLLGPQSVWIFCLRSYCIGRVTGWLRAALSSWNSFSSFYFKNIQSWLMSIQARRLSYFSGQNRGAKQGERELNLLLLYTKNLLLVLTFQFNYIDFFFFFSFLVLDLSLIIMLASLLLLWPSLLLR